MRPLWTASVAGREPPPDRPPAAFTYLTRLTVRRLARLKDAHLLDAQLGEVVRAVLLVDEDVPQLVAAQDQRLAVHARDDERLIHDLLVDVGGDLLARRLVALALELVEHGVDLGAAHADVGRAAGLLDHAAVGHLREERERVVPVGLPAVHRKAQLVLPHERRAPSELLEVVALREALRVQLDTDPAERLLQRLGRRLLLRPLLAERDTGLEAVGLTALGQLVL